MGTILAAILFMAVLTAILAGFGWMLVNDQRRENEKRRAMRKILKDGR